MSAAVDKARFYLEQTVPELRELESKKIFDRKEIQAINRKRSDFEHKLNAPGSSPTDWARYLEYEFNVDILRRKRAKRIGAKVTKHSGPRRIFALLERATNKFPADLGLWMQYLDYAKRQKAFKRISTIWTKVVRLHPTKAELWVDAGRYAFDEQSDMVAARSYMQRGLRFCPKSTGLWLSYFRLELDYLVKVSARAWEMEQRLHSTMKTADEDEDQMMLPDITADEAFKDEEGKELIGASALQELSKSPALSGAIPLAIFDAAMNSLPLEVATDLAEDMFDAAVEYNMASRQTILDHIATSVEAPNHSSAVSQNLSIRLPLVKTRVNTAEFARSLAVAIADMNERLMVEDEHSRKLHCKSARWITAYLSIDALDPDIAKALRAVLANVVSSYGNLLNHPEASVRGRDLADGFSEAKLVWDISHSVIPSMEDAGLLEAMRNRWPQKIAALEAERRLIVANEKEA